MTHKCCVRDCEEAVKETRSRGLPLHKFPKDTLLRARWITSGGFEPDFKPTSSQIVCYRHFKQADYEIGRSHKLFLKKGSVPTVFDNYEQHPDPIGPNSAFITSRLHAREVKLYQQSQAASIPLPADWPNQQIELDSSSNNCFETSCSSLEASMDSSNSLQSANALPKKDVDSIGLEPATIAEPLTLPSPTESSPFERNTASAAALEDRRNAKVNDNNKQMLNRDLNFAPGDKLEAKDFNEKWYSAKVVETDWIEREVLIHFDKWSSRFDEWIPMDSSRLRMRQSQKEIKSKAFAIGERILATWGDGKKYPAKVNAALDNDKYDVLFDDGYSKILKASKMTKLVDMPVYKYEEENSYVGSKQERRDKKRKHTITELFQHHSKKKTKSEHEKGYRKQDSTDLSNVKYLPKPEPASGLIKIELDSRTDIQQNAECTGGVGEDYATFIGNLRVEIEDSTYKCPITGCYKNFRKENLLQMHIKHYHPEYSKFLGSTPNVADLAYARTIGESVEDVIPKKSRFTTITQSIQTIHGSATSVSHAVDSDFHQAEIDNKLENKLSVENNSSALEDNLSEQSNSCTMSPGTLFDMRFKEERTHTGIKTLPPVRQPSTQSVDDSEPPQYSNVTVDVQKLVTPIDKEKRHRKRQQYYCDSMGKVKKQRCVSENEENYDQYDDSLLDADDVADLDYKCNNFSNIKSETENNDTAQSQSDSIMMINGEVIKVEKLRREEIINCTCGFIEEDGLMIQCDLCLCWQHGHCNAIEKEKDVPEKYICYICQHSHRQRASKKYLHDQDWIREGKLPSIYSHPADVLKSNERAAMLKRSYDLITGLLQIQDLLHSLRVKVNIAQNKDHPKLYLWAKNWCKIKIPTFKAEPVPIMETVKTEHSSDGYQEENVKSKSELLNSDKNEPDQKLITSDTELMKILEEDSTQAEELKPLSKYSASSTFKDEGRILLDALTRNEFEEQDQQVPLIKSEINNHHPQAAAVLQPVIPEPEAPIDPVDCKLRLLEHIDHFQNYVDSTLTFVEAQLSALEDMNSSEKQNDNVDVRTKQTLQMLLHDTESIRKMAALC